MDSLGLIFLRNLSLHFKMPNKSYKPKSSKKRNLFNKSISGENMNKWRLDKDSNPFMIELKLCFIKEEKYSDYSLLNIHHHRLLSKKLW